MKCIFGKKSKKGSLMDPITVGALILTIAITIIVMMQFWGTFDTGMRSAVSGSVANESVTNALTSLTTTYSYLDYMIPILVGGLH